MKDESTSCWLGRSNTTKDNRGAPQHLNQERLQRVRFVRLGASTNLPSGMYKDGQGVERAWFSQRHAKGKCTWTTG